MSCVYPVIGRAAYSKAGRDKERLFIVVGIIDENFLLVADGHLHPIGRPKKKRIKHLRFTDLVEHSVAEKVERGRKPSDKDLQLAIIRIEEMLAARKN